MKITLVHVPPPEYLATCLGLHLMTPPRPASRKTRVPFRRLSGWAGWSAPSLSKRLGSCTLWQHGLIEITETSLSLVCPKRPVYGRVQLRKVD